MRVSRNTVYGIAFHAWRYKSFRASGNVVVPDVVLPVFRTIAWMDGYMENFVL